MNIELIIKSAFCTVGTVQLLKHFTKKLNVPGWVFVLVTIGVAAAYTLLPLNDKIFNFVLVVCGSTLFYDTISSAFENMFKKNTISGTEEN